MFNKLFLLIFCLAVTQIFAEEDPSKEIELQINRFQLHAVVCSSNRTELYVIDSATGLVYHTNDATGILEPPEFKPWKQLSPLPISE